MRAFHPSYGFYSSDEIAFLNQLPDGDEYRQERQRLEAEAGALFVRHWRTMRRGLSKRNDQQGSFFDEQ